MAKDKKELDGDIVSDEIIIGDPEMYRPKELPLIVTFPEGYNPSKAQIERAKVLNAFAYSYPDKWEWKKADLIKELKELRNAPDPFENSNSNLFVGKPLPK